LRRGRVAAVFTLWSPGAWRTSGGVRIGDRATSLAAAHERTSRTSCGGYAAHTLRTGRAVTAFYVVDGEVWGFGLLDRRTPVCR
jgi:hypothetical protein